VSKISNHQVQQKNAHKGIGNKNQHNVPRKTLPSTIVKKKRHQIGIEWHVEHLKDKEQYHQGAIGEEYQLKSANVIPKETIQQSPTKLIVGNNFPLK